MGSSTNEHIELILQHFPRQSRVNSKQLCRRAEHKLIYSERVGMWRELTHNYEVKFTCLSRV